ncbi:MAG TPA: phosphotransferase [Caldilineaceae bacterium]|nr:phosphotransferase [Caldilineaceae bacterium]
MLSEADYLQHIQQTFPDLELRAVKINRDGMVNVSVIVNRERVFRFPRAEWGIALMRNEANVLDLLRKHVALPIPDWDYCDFDPMRAMVSYPFIAGAPLLTDDLLRMSDPEQDQVAATLGLFLRQMHAIPISAVHAAQIGPSDTVRTIDDWLQLYADVQEHLFPLLWEDGREWVRRHFAPLLADHSLMDHDPCFMNGDLAPYHLLFDRERNTFTGIIDFGTAGIGDPAADFCTMINQYGESFLRRMACVYPEISEHIDRARFWAGTLELQWLLRGLRDGMQDMLVVHIGRKRDLLPIGSGWV